MTPEELKAGLPNVHEGVVYPGNDAGQQHHIYFEAHYSPTLSHFEFLHELIEHLESMYESLAKFNAERGYNTPKSSEPTRTKPFLTATDVIWLREMRVGL